MVVTDRQTEDRSTRDYEKSSPDLRACYLVLLLQLSEAPWPHMDWKLYRQLNTVRAACAGRVKMTWNVSKDVLSLMRQEPCRNCSKNINYNKYIYPSFHGSVVILESEKGKWSFMKCQRTQREIYSAFKKWIHKTKYFCSNFEGQRSLNWGTRKGALVLCQRVLEASKRGNLVWEVGIVELSTLQYNRCLISCRVAPPQKTPTIP